MMDRQVHRHDGYIIKIHRDRQTDMMDGWVDMTDKQINVHREGQIDDRERLIMARQRERWRDIFNLSNRRRKTCAKHYQSTKKRKK